VPQADSVDRLATALVDAQVDLNPHQVDAALFAFRSPLSKRVLLARALARMLHLWWRKAVEVRLGSRRRSRREHELGFPCSGRLGYVTEPTGRNGHGIRSHLEFPSASSVSSAALTLAFLRDLRRASRSGAALHISYQKEEALHKGVP
jgi:hypothetical protein